MESSRKTENTFWFSHHRLLRTCFEAVRSSKGERNLMDVLFVPKGFGEPELRVIQDNDGNTSALALGSSGATITGTVALEGDTRIHGATVFVRADDVITIDGKTSLNGTVTVNSGEANTSTHAPFVVISNV